MRFWDASALVPLCVPEEHTESAKALLRKDGGVIVWWGTLVECYSAFARLRREGGLEKEEEENAREPLLKFEQRWVEIRPGRAVRQQAIRCISVHGLKAADALQLAAAFVWADSNPVGNAFVCLDAKLREAAKMEGFTVHPAAT